MMSPSISQDRARLCRSDEITAQASVDLITVELRRSRVLDGLTIKRSTSPSEICKRTSTSPGNRVDQHRTRSKAMNSAGYRAPPNSPLKTRNRRSTPGNQSADPGGMSHFGTSPRMYL
jgi:hypothetical protein